MMAKSITLDWDLQPKSKKKKKSLLDEFDDLESSSSVISFSERSEEGKKKEEEYKEMKEANEEVKDDWFLTLEQFRDPKVKTSSRKKGNPELYDFLSGGNGKKKKKKKKGDKKELKDYKEEFESETALMRNLLADSTRFTDSLQKRYDTLEASKSSARGVGKFTTDLISAINQSRSVSLQLLDKISSLKKTAIELNMKERKEFGANGIGDSDDIRDFSANLLKKMIQQDRSDAAFYGDDTPMDGNEDAIFGNISEALEGTDRSSDIDKYLKYENRNVSFMVNISRGTGEFEVVAVASDGEYIDDYPIPKVEHLDINESTGIATDEYHNRYSINWVE